jgi:nitroreductase
MATKSATSARDLVRNGFPSPKSNLAEAQKNFNYDLERFFKHSGTEALSLAPIGLESVLTAMYHAIEKGLTFEETRQGFGKSKIPFIIAAIEELERLGEMKFATDGARGCLQAYVKHYESRGLPLPKEIEPELLAFVKGMDGHKHPGGTIKLNKAEIESSTNFDYERFIESRFSVRHFTGERVSQETIHRAVGLALKTPRTCNREMRRVYAAYEPEFRDHVLSFHVGNKGFGHKLGALLIVTADIRELYEIAERNQAWIDGGLFAMSLVYALHASRVGTCMLNWSVDCDRDALFRKEFEIPDYEVIVTFVGVGHLPEEFEVAASPGPNADDVLSVLSQRR